MHAIWRLQSLQFLFLSLSLSLSIPDFPPDWTHNSEDHTSKSETLSPAPHRTGNQGYIDSGGGGDGSGNCACQTNHLPFLSLLSAALLTLFVMALCRWCPMGVMAKKQYTYIPHPFYIYILKKKKTMLKFYIYYYYYCLYVCYNNVVESNLNQWQTEFCFCITLFVCWQYPMIVGII